MPASYISGSRVNHLIQIPRSDESSSKLIILCMARYAPAQADRIAA
jgi:hypothetical protein